jgi:hypothetical protein
MSDPQWQWQLLTFSGLGLREICPWLFYDNAWLIQWYPITFNDIVVQLVSKNLDVNEHERLSNFTLRYKLK